MMCFLKLELICIIRIFYKSGQLSMRILQKALTIIHSLYIPSAIAAGGSHPARSKLS